MTCEHCVARVRSALQGVEGVQSAVVVLADEMLTAIPELPRDVVAGGWSQQQHWVRRVRPEWAMVRG